MKALAAVHFGPTPKTIFEQIDLDEPVDDEVLVRIAGSGICHTDLLALKGALPVPLPMIFGHEGAGIVEQIGPDVIDLKPGDPVVLSFASCGTCPSCARRTPAFCHAFGPQNFAGLRQNGRTSARLRDKPVHGSFFGQSSFASHSLARRRNMVKVDSDDRLDILGPLGCGILTGAGSVLNVLQPTQDGVVIIIGAGAVGLSAMLAAKSLGCRTIIVVDRNADRLAVAEKLGATGTIVARDDVVLSDAIKHHFPIGADFIVEATGVGALAGEVIRALAPGGACCLAGVYGDASDLNVSARTLMSRGLRVCGTIEGNADPHTLIPDLHRRLRAGTFPYDKLVEKYPFAHMDAALADMASGRSIKPVLVM